MTTTANSLSSKKIYTSITGSKNDDRISVNKNRVYASALNGDDTILIRSGLEDIVVDAGADKDRIICTAEVLNSTFTLGTGDDYSEFQDFSGTIFGGTGNDTLIAASARTTKNSLIRGNSGRDDFTFGNINNSIINLNADDDVIVVNGAIKDGKIYGGRQNDSIYLNKSVANSLIRGDDDQDAIVVNGELSNSIVNGNNGSDQITINSANISSSSIYGGKGSDNIDINSEAIYVNGGQNGDNINLRSSKLHTVYGGRGDDTITASSTKALWIDSGNDHDVITLTGVAVDEAFHTVDGGAGNDSINGTRGKDFIDGGTENNGNDTLISSGGNDTIYGRAGDDLINLEGGAYSGIVSVHAGAGDDIVEVKLQELTYKDIIKGEKDIDTIAVVGSSANFDMWIPDTDAERAFESISGFETLSFGTPNNNYRVSGTKTVRLANNVQKAGIQTIDATNASASGKLVVDAFLFSSRTNLSFLGSDDKDVKVSFVGGSGDDTLTTGKYTAGTGDTFTGGLGQDTFVVIASDSNTVITDLGEDGADILQIKSSARGVVATVKKDYIAPDETGNLKSTASVVLNAESGVDIDMTAAGGEFGYTINGGANASYLQGSNYHDSISGNTRADTIQGNRGNDTVYGGGGADIIIAGKGNTTINDAGIGADRIDHSSGSSCIIQNAGSDTVTLNASRPNAYVLAANTIGFASVAEERTVDASSSTANVTLDGRLATLHKVTYTGGVGNDTFFGGSVGDSLVGNTGNDTFTGGLGADTINVGGNTNTVIFTSGITADIITGFTNDDVGSFNITNLEVAGAVVNGDTLDFVRGDGNSVLAGDSISIKAIAGATTLSSTTNVLNYTAGPMANAGALETALEGGGGAGIITTNGALAANDAFIIQYQNSNTSTYSYAIANVESAVNASSIVNNWEVTDIASTDFAQAFSETQFSFIA